MTRLQALPTETQRPDTRDDTSVMSDFNIPTSEEWSKSLDPLLGTIVNKCESKNPLNPCTTTRLSQIRTQVEGLRNSSTVPQRNVLARLAALHKLHNELVPFHRLPLELRVPIILDSLARKGASTYKPYYKRLAQLSTISTSWWLLIKGSWEFWTVVDVGNSVQAQCALKRSGSALLHINFDTTGAVFQDCIDRVASHFHRCQILNMQIRHADDLAACLVLLQSSAPSLQALQVRVDFELPPHRLSINLDKAPNITNLSLQEIIPTWMTVVAPPIKTLALSWMKVSRLNMAHILARCSNLEELDLDSLCLDQSASTTAYPVSLPAMRKLTLGQFGRAFQDFGDRRSALQVLEDLIQEAPALEFVQGGYWPSVDPSPNRPYPFLKRNAHDKPSLLATTLKNAPPSKLVLQFNSRVDLCLQVRGESFINETIGLDIAQHCLRPNELGVVVRALMEEFLPDLKIEILAVDKFHLRTMQQCLREVDCPVWLRLGPENIPDIEAIHQLSCPNLVEVQITYQDEELLPKSIRDALDYDPTLLPFADPPAFPIRGLKIAPTPPA